MYQTGASRDNEIVALKLSIGQCKLIEQLIDAELALAEGGISTFNEKSLQTLTDVFMRATQETEAERQERFKNWVGGLKLVGLKHV